MTTIPQLLKEAEELWGSLSPLERTTAPELVRGMRLHDFRRIAAALLIAEARGHQAAEAERGPGVELSDADARELAALRFCRDKGMTIFAGAADKAGPGYAVRFDEGRFYPGHTLAEAVDNWSNATAS